MLKSKSSKIIEMFVFLKHVHLFIFVIILLYCFYRFDDLLFVFCYPPQNAYFQARYLPTAVESLGLCAQPRGLELYGAVVSLAPALVAAPAQALKTAMVLALASGRAAAAIKMLSDADAQRTAEAGEIDKNFAKAEGELASLKQAAATTRSKAIVAGLETAAVPLDPCPKSGKGVAAARVSKLDLAE